DTLMYTLAGLEGADGWGLRGDTLATLERLRDLGGDEWFTIGDRDLATHLYRTGRLRAGDTLTDVTHALMRAHGIAVTCLPVTDEPHPTIVRTGEGALPFQDYFVRLRSGARVTGFDFPGRDARPSAGVLRA